MQKLDIKWTSHIREENKKEDFEKYVRNCKTVLERLFDILDEEEKSLLKVKVVDYESPSWAFRQAHLNGKMELLRQIKSILSFTKG